MGSSYSETQQQQLRQNINYVKVNALMIHAGYPCGDISFPVFLIIYFVACTQQKKNPCLFPDFAQNSIFIWPMWKFLVFS